MKWVLSVLCGAALLTGCNGSGQTIDPFLGRTTIPPPGTGQVLTPGTAQPYYQGNPLPGAVAPVTPLPGGPAPLYTPPAGSSYRDNNLGQGFVETPADREYRVGRAATVEPASALRRVQSVIHLNEPQLAMGPQLARGNAEQALTAGLPETAWQTTTENRSAHDLVAGSSHVRIPGDSLTIASPARFAGPLATAATFDESQEIAPVAPSQAARLTAPASFRPPTGAVDISQLPRVSQSNRTGGLTTPVVFESRSKSPRVALPSSKGATRRPAERYGYASDHSWLKGQLEYLSSKQQWKLRYIPIDGETDEFGGSVVISDSSQLDKYEAGQFVTIRGSIDASSTGTSSFAPRFRVERIKRGTE
jgi:hypothetical protein